MPTARWNYESIRLGVERFVADNGRPPTAIDFDRTKYLPSARQVQRAFGGLESLRRELGHEDLNYTKGSLRSPRSAEGYVRGTSAEDALEVLLIKKFGEPFVHTQKRYYKDHRNRYDFFVYYTEGFMGIDVFSTTRREYIGPNIRHKLPKYGNVPADTPIFFVVASDTLAKDDVKQGALMAKGLSKRPDITVEHISAFMERISHFEPLQPPSRLKTVL